MNIDFNRINNLKLKTKFLAISYLIFFMITAVLLTVFFSYNDIEKGISKIVKRDVNLVIKNADIGINISKIFSELTLLANSHIETNKQWITKKSNLLNLTSSLLEQIYDEELIKTVKDLNVPLSVFFDQGMELTININKLFDFDNTLILQINDLEYLIEGKIRNYAIIGKDTTNLKASRIKVLEYRERIYHAKTTLTILQYNKVVMTEKKRVEFIKNIIEQIDTVYTDLRIFKVLDSNVTKLAKKTISTLLSYRNSIINFKKKLSDFRKFYNDLLGKKKKIIFAMSHINKDVSQTANNIQRKLEMKINSSIIILILLSISVLAILIIQYIFVRFTIKPIFHLTDVAKKMSQGNLEQEIHIKNKDEIGSLALSFATMRDAIKRQIKELEDSHDKLDLRVIERTKELKNTQVQLVELSRESGMAEIATNVIHNVGNALNSINISSEITYEKLKTLRLSVLEKVVTLLDENKENHAQFIANDVKGKMLPDVIKQFFEYLLIEKDDLLKEIENIKNDILHIQNIVYMQQSYAKNVLVEELHSAQEIMEDAIRMNRNALHRHNIRIITEFDNIKKTKIDKHKVLQILLNLISNAKYSFLDSSQKNKTIVCSIKNIDNKFIELKIKDNGKGITKKNLNKIFNYGFTTRKDGHGFGLHNSANTARQIGGELSVISDGPNKGACFVLKLAIIIDSFKEEV